MMIQNILNKAYNGERPDLGETLKLFRIQQENDFRMLMNTAFEISREHTKIITLTSTIHITNCCAVTPKCGYCGFAAGSSSAGYFQPFFKSDEEILDAAIAIEKSGITRVSCSGAHGYQGAHAVKAAKIVKENTSLELLVNVGCDLTGEALDKIARYGTETVCCNLETINETVFNAVKPGESLDRRMKICRMVSESGMQLSSGLLIGLGESYEDRVSHLEYLRRFKSLAEIPLMGFNPYTGTPMEHHPPCPLKEQMKTIAIARILFPSIRITVPTPTIGPENVRYSLIAGADNLATVIPDNYPHQIKGVGSPRCGTLKEVVKTIRAMGLEPKIKNPAALATAGDSGILRGS